ncbi:hypothetical protein [Kineococcus sp. SYSU DK003]|uniref:hypothetical protein n=1 Tax=Kineococcus sp. SYSU DK003 TaxID=3383124 RepID=UPI003D7EE36D
MSLHAEPRAAQEPPRRARRAGVVLAGVVTAAGLATAVTLALVLDDRADRAADDLRGRLQLVADAQTSWHAEHGEYSLSLADLGVGESSGDLAIVSAGADAFCAGAYDGRTDTALFFSPAGGFSGEACP